LPKKSISGGIQDILLIPDCFLQFYNVYIFAKISGYKFNQEVFFDLLEMDITKKINEIAVSFFDDNNSKFAAAMGTSEANIRNYRSKTSPKIEFIVKLCNNLKISFEWMFNNSGEMIIPKNSGLTSSSDKTLSITEDNLKSQRIPLYEMNTQTSLTQLFDKNRPVIDYITIPNLPKSDGALHIRGDGMYPLLKSGDIAIYKKVSNLEDGIYYGEMYLLSIDIDGDEATVVKYVRKSDKGDQYINLTSYNTNHASKDVNLKYIRTMALIKASICFNTIM